VFQTARVAKLSAATVNASLLLHAAAILLLCLLSWPAPRSQRSHEQLTLIAPSPEIPMRPTFKAAPKARPQATASANRSSSQPPSQLRSRLTQERGRFEAPPRVPELLPKRALNLPLTPELDLLLAPLPEPVPNLPAFPPPARPALVKASGFASAGNTVAEVKPRRSSAIGGFEAASTEAMAAPGVAQDRGVVLASGFTPEHAAPATIPARLPVHGAAGFGDASVAAPSARLAKASSSSSSAAALVSSAEILEKPRPSYTEEARRLNIEGEVVIEVLFQSAGQAKVLRIVQGLGHGLDESAMAAARQIRFRPAQRGGVPVDSSALVHIVFQLAY
jgi:TonB family protein